MFVGYCLCLRLVNIVVVCLFDMFGFYFICVVWFVLLWLLYLLLCGLRVAFRLFDYVCVWFVWILFWLINLFGLCCFDVYWLVIWLLGFGCTVLVVLVWMFRCCARCLVFRLVS